MMDRYVCTKKFELCTLDGETGKPSVKELTGDRVLQGSLWEGTEDQPIPDAKRLTDGLKEITVTTDDGFFDAHFEKQCCNTCRTAMPFAKCEVLKENVEYQDIWNKASEGEYLSGKAFSLAFDFKEDFVCDDWVYKYISYPLTIGEINHPQGPDYTERCLYKNTIGKYVKVRPAGDGKTYLGLFLGELPIGLHVTYKEADGSLNIDYWDNPAMFVFALNKIVFGCGSWWSEIDSPEELKDISDDQINSIWYVQALKLLGGEE